jgi:protocatechuate 3,4-dioxygenase beta subunit
LIRNLRRFIEVPAMRSTSFRLACIALFLTLAACDERSPSAPPGAVPSALAVRGGDGQEGTVGAALPEELVVEVVDAAGRALPGFAVQFSVVAGGGQVTASGVTSDAQGRVRTHWTLGTAATDSQVVEARLGQLAPARLRATARPDAPATLAATGGSGGAGPVGGALADSLAVTVRDRHGNPVAGLEVAWTAASGGGSLSPARAVTGVDGVAKAQWMLGPRVDSAQAAVAWVAGLDSVAFTAHAVTAGVPLLLSKRSGDGQRGAAGSVLADSLGVVLRMQDGRPVAGALVTWSVPPAAGIVTPAVSRTDANGAASALWRLGNGSGLAQATATVDQGALTFTALTEADAPAALVAVAGGGEGPVGGVLADSLAVRVTDQHGNLVQGAAVDWSVAAGGGAVSPARSATDAQGIARAQWTLGPGVSGTQTARAVLASLAPVAFSATATTAGVPLQLVKRGGDGQRGPVGSILADSLSVVLRMQDGRPVAGALVSWSVPATAGTVTPATSRTDANGAASALWRLGSGTGLAQATAMVDQGALTFTALAEADAPAAIAAVAGGGEGPVGGALADSLAVRVTDQHGNPVQGAAVDWSVASGGGAVSPARSATDAQGIARAQWTLGPSVAGTQTTRAVLSGLVPVAFSATASTAGVPLQLAKRGGDGQRGPVGSILADSLSVVLRMQDGRPVAGALVSWSVPATAGTVTPATSRTDANGAASAVWRLGSGTGLAQATATVDQGALTFTALVEADAPAAVGAVAGGGEGPVGGAMADSLAVRVTDRHGNPVAGTMIDWAVTSGGGAVSPARSATDAQGIARAQWTLGLLAGTPGQTASGTLAGLPPVAFQATAVTRGVPLQLIGIAGDGQTGGVRAVLADSLVVALRTPAGAPIQGATVVWAATGGGRVSPAASRTDAQGRARAAWTLGAVAGTQLSSATVDEGTLRFFATARQDAAYGLRLVGGDGQSATRGTRLPNFLEVRVVDAYGNGVPETWVRWQVVRGGGRLEADSSLTGADGRARMRWALGLSAGANRVIATVPGLSGQIGFNATGQAGDLVFTRISRVPIPTTGSSNTVDFFDELLVAAVTDLQGVPVVGATVRWPPRPGEVVSTTGWDGRAAWRWDAVVRLGRGGPIYLSAQFESDTVQWYTVPLRAAEYEYYFHGIDFDPPSAVAGDTVMAFAGISELFDRFPPGFTVQWWDDNGWSATTGGDVRWPVGSRSGTRTINLCTNSTEGGDVCGSATYDVEPPPDPAGQRR